MNDWVATRDCSLNDNLGTLRVGIRMDVNFCILVFVECTCVTEVSNRDTAISVACLVGGDGFISGSCIYK
jgi:hypothetical protein